MLRAYIFMYFINVNTFILKHDIV